MTNEDAKEFLLIAHEVTGSDFIGPCEACKGDCNACLDDLEGFMGSKSLLDEQLKRLHLKKLPSQDT